MDKMHKIISILKKSFPKARVALKHDNPLELLIATILSAQCTDERVNKVTPALFDRYKNARDFAGASLKELEGFIRSTGFYHNKAKNIQNAARIINDKYHGKVPSTMEELIELPGVARKTANIVLFNAFNKLEGIAVDTHVKRVSGRLGFTKNIDPIKIENDLMKLVPKRDWGIVSNLLILHGRNICVAIKPKCPACPLIKLCPSAKIFLNKKEYYEKN